MYGKTMGTLAIKLEQSNGVSWLIFYEKGSKGMGWKKGSGNINVDVGFRYQVRTQHNFLFTEALLVILSVALWSLMIL